MPGRKPPVLITEEICRDPARLARALDIDLDWIGSLASEIKKDIQDSTFSPEQADDNIDPVIIDPDPDWTLAHIILGDSPAWWLRLAETQQSGTATAVDSSGNSFNGGYGTAQDLIMHEPSLTSDTTDYSLKYYSGSGNCSIYVPFTPYTSPSNPAPTTPLTDVSWEAWVKPNTTADRMIMTQSGNVNPNNASTLYLWSHGGKFEAVIQDGPVYPTNIKVAQAPSTYTVNTTYHVVATATSGGFLRLYVNGNLETTTAIGTMVAVAGNWSCGGSSSLQVGGALWSGWLDDVAVYYSALTAAQVLAHYEAGS